MKLTNNTHNTLVCLEGKKIISLAPAETKDIPDNIAKCWLKVPGVIEVKEVVEEKTTTVSKKKKVSK